MNLSAHCTGVATAHKVLWNIPALDMHTLLGKEEDPMLNSWRDVNLMELSKYIKETGRQSCR